MSYNGNEGEFISLQNGATLTANYRNANSTNTNLVLAHYFGKNKLQDLINQTGCVGLRFYYGLGSTGAPAIVVVGVDSSQNDILGSTPLVLDMSVMCPPTCSNTNSLNS